MKSLRVATCQFPVEPDVLANASYIKKQMRQAAGQGCDLAHFSECALSGYAGVDFPSFKKYDWQLLKECTEEILTLAGELKLWTILGSSHKLTGNHKPHNSLYVINDRGKMIDRYDKRFCTGILKPKPTMDQCHYTPGNHPVTVKVKGVT